MYFTDLDIPYEIVIFLLKQEIWDKNFNDGGLDAFKTVILPKPKATKPKIERTIQDIINLNCYDRNGYKIKEEDIYTKTIKNTDIELYILSEQGRRVYYDRDYCVYIGAKFSGLKVLYNIVTPVRASIFIDIVSQCRYVSDGKIHGSFIYRGFQNYYQYRPEDDNLLENLRRTNLISETRKTTSLEPGHIYIMKDKTKILYLGSLKESRENNRSVSKSNNGISFFTTSITGVKYQTYHSDLFINLDIIDRRSYYSDGCLLEFIDSQKGAPISEFIPKWIEFYEETKEDISDCIYYNWIAATGSGIDQGEFLKNDNPELERLLGDLCVVRLNKALEEKNKARIIMYALGCGSFNLRSLSDNTKDKIFELIIKPELDRMFKNITYRIRSETREKIIAENTSSSNIFMYMKGVGLYYIEILDQLCNTTNSNSFGRILFEGRDDKLNSLIIESKKANFKL